MRTHTNEFKEELKVFGRQIQGKIIYYPSYDLVSESDDNILSETDLQIISEQANYDDPIEIDAEDIFSISIIKNGDLLQSLMKEFDFETKEELNIGSVVNPQLGLLVNEDYEYLNYGNYIINSKEFNMDTETWSYVCYDKMLFSMVKYRGLSNVEYPITIKQFIDKLCNKVGLEFEDSEFVNQGQLIYEDLYKNRDVTYRDIFDEISKIAAGNLLINDEDKLEVGYINNLTTKLPSDYTQVDYVESNGNKYITTGVINNANIRVVTVMSVVGSDKLCGGEVGGTNGRYKWGVSNSGNLYIGYGSNNYGSSVSHTLNDYYTYDIARGSQSIKDMQGNTLISYSNTTLTKYWAYSIRLFKANDSITSTGTMRIKSCQIYENNVLIRDFIPCYRNSDGVVGLYDLVNDVFYTNRGTGSFTYGKAISDTINEDYLKDTNVRMSEKIGVINSVAILDNDNDLQYIAEDTQSIKENEMTRITITDNLIAMNGETQDIADNILNKLNGLYYYANDLQTTGVCYYDFLDLFNVEARGNTYQCLLLNNEITITQGIEEHIFTEKFEELETSANEYTTSVITNKQVQFKINQQEGRIESKVEKDGVISAINQSAEEIQIQANKLSLEGKNINLTGDNIKITSKNLDIDSNGVINLTDNSAETTLTGETQEVAYIVSSQATATPSGTNVNLELENKVIASGIISKADVSYEYDGTTTSYTTGIQTSTFSQPRITLYGQSGDYEASSNIGSYNSLDMSLNAGISYSSTNNGTISTPLIITPNGNITCVSLTQTSKKENKKNFEKLTNAKEILNQVDIYKYNFKGEDDNVKKSIGFVIGDNFNYSQEITSENNDGANIYSMVSVLWQVVKEQQKEIEELKEMIKNGKH